MKYTGRFLQQHMFGTKVTTEGSKNYSLKNINEPGKENGTSIHRIRHLTPSLTHSTSTTTTGRYQKPTTLWWSMKSRDGTHTGCRSLWRNTVVNCMSNIYDHFVLESLWRNPDLIIMFKNNNYGIPWKMKTWNWGPWCPGNVFRILYLDQ